MLDKSEKLLTKFAFLSSYFVYTIQDCLTYTMINCPKAMKISVNEIIGDIISDHR